MRVDKPGLPLGRFFGVNVVIDWSWIIIFLLVTWSLAAGLFPSWHPEWGPALSWGLAAAASLLFFASILAHELAHSLVAKARGLPVRSITLFIFGGVSNLQREPASAGVEFVIALVGPVTSIALGILFTALGVASGGRMFMGPVNPIRSVSQAGPLPTLLAWLGPINLLIGIFNLIPGFPLDGGRLLRAVIWSVTGNLRTATRWATRVGRLVALLFILAGLAMAFGARVPLFGTGFISGLWLAFIGWFLNDAAIAGERAAEVYESLRNVPVSQLMRPGVTTAIPPDLAVSSLVYDWIMPGDEKSFPVMDNGRFEGVVSVDDVRKLPQDVWDYKKVSEIMTPATRLLAVSPGEEAIQALDKLEDTNVRQVPVMDDGHLVGMLRRRDIARWLELHAQSAR